MTRNTIRKGMCYGCPWDVGNPATENAFNLGCLPSIGEATSLAAGQTKAWACHEEPHKVCCGFAADNKAKIDLPLYRDGHHGAEYVTSDADSEEPE